MSGIFPANRGADPWSELLANYVQPNPIISMKNQSNKFLLLTAGLVLAAISPAFGSEAEDMFKRMDTNGDKKVTMLEHAQFAETMFKQSDADFDGKVSVAECEAAQTKDHAKVNKEAVVKHMRLVDTDGDGQISATENAAYAKSMFTRADKNGDGVLSEDEVEAFHKTMKKEMKD